MPTRSSHPLAPAPGASLRRLLGCVALALLPACDLSTGTGDLYLTTDTLEIAAPTADRELPSAIDVSAYSGVMGGERFPEYVEDAENWDLAVRLVDGELVLAPAEALGLSSMAAITGSLIGETFESLDQAPATSAFRRDSAVVLRLGEVYAARSRTILCSSGSSGEQYAKLQPVEMDLAGGTVRLVVTTNETCSDPRL